MDHMLGIPDDALSEISDVSEPPSTTTISTVAVQAGKAKIVLAILRVSGRHFYVHAFK